MLADALLHVVREAPLGSELLLTAAMRAVCDLKQQVGCKGKNAGVYKETNAGVRPQQQACTRGQMQLGLKGGNLHQFSWLS